MAGGFTTFHLSISGSKGVATNSKYKEVKKITNLKQFQEATNYDHTCGRFSDHTRKKNNFISADCIFIDVDNDDPTQQADWDDAKLWMTIAKFHEHFHGVEHIITPSKSHRTEKNGRASRDRFHVYFPLDHTLEREEYEEAITYLIALFTRADGITWFDTNATDVSRFFYGRTTKVSIPPEHRGGKSILTWIAEHPKKEEVQQTHFQVSSPGTQKIKSEAEGSSRKAMWLGGFKFNKLVKGKDPAIFYGHLNIESQTNEYWKVRCTSGKHEDKQASLQIDKETLTYHCWVCGSGNPLQFMALREGMTEEEVVDMLCENFDIVRKSKGSIAMDGEVIQPNDPSPEEKQIEEINKNHAVIIVGGKVRIMKWGRKQARTASGTTVVYPELDFMTFEDMLKLYQNRMIVWDGQQKNLALVWMQHHSRKEYDGLIFDPTKKTPPQQKEAWNIWFDWDTKQGGYTRFIDPKKYNAIKNGKQAYQNCRLYLDHIQNNICGNFPTDAARQKAAEYIVIWMADALLKPTKRNNTAIVLRSGAGSGKGQFVGKFAELFGNHYTHIHNMDQVSDQFNWHLKDNLLLFADEALFAGDKKGEGNLKGLIVDESRQLRKLYSDPVSVPNYTRLMIASNNDWVVPLDMDDRRFFVIDVKEGKARDSEYFEAMNDEWVNGGKEALCYFLIEVIAKRNEFDKYNFDKERPQSSAQWDQILLSNPIIEWWEDVLERGEFVYKDDENNIQRLQIAEDHSNQFWQIEKIHADYILYKEKHKSGRFIEKINVFSKTLGKLGISFNKDRRKDIEIDGRLQRRTIWEFGSLSVLRNEWENKTGNKKWSEAKLITHDETAGVIEQLATGDDGLIVDTNRSTKKELMEKIKNIKVD